MTEQQISEALDQIVDLVTTGKALEALDLFYHDNLEKTDLNGITIYGKDASRKILANGMAQITEIREFTSVGYLFNGNRSFQVWSIDYDHKENGRVKVVEVALQDWEDGKIIREKYMA